MILQFAASVGLMMALMGPIAAQDAPQSTSHFIIFQGSTGTAPVTILLDQATGYTWFLGQEDAMGHTYLVPPVYVSGTSLVWVPLAYFQAPSAPAATQPPGK